MATKKPKTIDVTGMRISDIMNIDIDTFNSLGEKDLKMITSRLVSAGNKRIRRLEEQEIVSPALRSLGTDYRFSVKNLNINQLRQEYANVRNFLSMKTSTIRGYQSYISDVREEIRKSANISKKDMKNVDISKVFERLHKLQERGVIPTTTGKKGSSKGSIHARDYIVEQMVANPEISEKRIFKLTEQNYNDYYEKRETEETEI